MLIDKPPPHCSAQSWVVYDRETDQALFGRMEKERREVASLTKIMTFYTALKLVDKYNLDIKAEFITVCEETAAVTGTTANLLEGDKLTIE